MKFSLRRTSIRTKVSAALFAVLMIVVLLTTTLFYVFRHKNLDFLHKTFSEILHVYSTRVEQELDEIELYAFDLISDPVLQEQLIKLNTVPKNLEFIEIAEHIDERLLHLTNRMGLEKVLFIDINNRIASSRRDHPDVEKFIAGGYPEHLIKTNNHEEWILTSSNVSSVYYIRIIRKIEKLDLTPIGIILMEVNKNNVWKSVRQSYPFRDLSLQIRYNQRKIFSTDDSDQLFAVDIDEGIDKYEIHTFDSEKFFISTYNSPNKPLTYILSVPYSSYFKEFQIYTLMAFSILGILFFLIIPASVLFARNFTDPIVELSQGMKEVESEDFQTLISRIPRRGRNDEIGLLYSEFRIMLNKINILVNENLKKQILIKDTQIRNLQAQINPHFLYNTLESINWLAKLNDQEEIAAMVQSLGALFRSSVAGNLLIPLGEEILLLKHYVGIQKIRFGDRLDVSYSIDETCLSHEVPKFLLQPLVENSIKYGVEMINRKCSIAISARCDDRGDAVISVRDDGPGMTEERREEILSGEYRSNSTGIGLKNIMERLHQIFGENKSFTLKSEEGEGTEIQIRISAISDENRKLFLPEEDGE